MPVIRSTYDGADGLLSLTPEKGGMQKYTHIQRVDEIALRCKELRKDPRKGMSEDGTMQLIASIPEAAYFGNPRFIDPDGRINMKELRRYLQSPEGEMYKATEARI